MKKRIIYGAELQNSTFMSQSEMARVVSLSDGSILKIFDLKKKRYLEYQLDSVF